MVCDQPFLNYFCYKMTHKHISSLSLRKVINS